MKRAIISMIFLSAVYACTGSTPFSPDSDIAGGGQENTDDKKPSGPEAPAESAEGELRANGDNAGTYRLITDCGYNYESPDQYPMNHPGIQHIQQSYDKTLGKWVFDFYIHADEDKDRDKTSVTDRQRNEIKTDGHSPASMVAQQGEEMIFRWKFRLPEGMRTTTKFCHIHQIKGLDNKEGTADVGTPSITYTLRTQSNGNQQFQIIYVGPTELNTGNVYFAKADLSEFLGKWVEVEERIRFGADGSYSTVIKRVSDGKTIVKVDGEECNMWRSGTTGMRPKWGIYRSFGDGGSLKSELRDEILKFADFSVEKVAR